MASYLGATQIISFFPTLVQSLRARRVFEMCSNIDESLYNVCSALSSFRHPYLSPIHSLKSQRARFESSSLKSRVCIFRRRNWFVQVQYRSGQHKSLHRHVNLVFCWLRRFCQSTLFLPGKSAHCNSSLQNTKKHWVTLLAPDDSPAT